MSEQAISRLRGVIRGLCDVAETIENVSEKVVEFVDEFAVNLEREVDKLETQAHEREQAMQRHPAGKGRVENNEPTREEKIKVIQDWLRSKSTVWHINPSSIEDATVDAGYDVVLRDKAEAARR